MIEEIEDLEIMEASGYMIRIESKKYDRSCSSFIPEELLNENKTQRINEKIEEMKKSLLDYINEQNKE